MGSTSCPADVSVIRRTEVRTAEYDVDRTIASRGLRREDRVDQPAMRATNQDHQSLFGSHSQGMLVGEMIGRCMVASRTEHKSSLARRGFFTQWDFPGQPEPRQDLSAVALLDETRSVCFKKPPLERHTDGPWNLRAQAQTGFEETVANVNQCRSSSVIEHGCEPSGMVVVAMAHDNRIELREVIFQPERLGIAHQCAGGSRVEKHATSVCKDQQ